MDNIGPLVDVLKGFWGLASKPLGYIYNLKDNVRSLGEANEDLKAVYEGVKARVEREEEEGSAQCTKQVENWLGKVQGFDGTVDQVLQEAGEYGEIKCLHRWLPRNCWLSYELGKRVDQLLNEVRKLQEEKRGFSDVTSPLPPPQVLEMPMDETVGLDSSLNKVWKWLVDKKKAGVIGLYGIGGVGKTTLMKSINRKLSKAKHGFEVVIWVEVSSQVNINSIQDTVRKRLDIKDELWKKWSWDERVHHLWEDLTRKKYVLLIDDLWEWLDLSKIGVPRPGLEKGSKIVFTTRSEQLCHQMRTNETLKLQYLTPEEAQKLFEEKFGKLLVDCDQEIQDLAKDVVGECKGLPLALITVGRAMAGKENPREWRNALKMLRNNPHELPGMVKEVYKKLEFSYNNLNDSTIQNCFLYFRLFPEDYPIKTDEIIELWIGEGMLGHTNDVYGMRDKGEDVLWRLKNDCLLESGQGDYGEQYVKMHDVIRDMAIWIARDHGQKENNWLVIKKEEDMSAEMISKWRGAKKLSLWGGEIRDIDPKLSQCSQLETLLIRKTDVKEVPNGFFDSRLTFLDTSGSRNIQSLPKGICKLINLWYLNLSATCISELPREIKNLTRLRWLLLDDTRVKILIPTGTITSLPLIVFSQWSSNTSFRRSSQMKEEEIVEELDGMQHLIDLSIRVSKSSSALKIFQSSNLSRCIRRAWISDEQNDLVSIVISCSPAGSDGFPHLEVLHLYDCFVLKKVEIIHGIERAPTHSCFPSLVTIHIRWCGLSDLLWLVHAPILRELRVMECKSMEKIIGDGFAPGELAASKLFSHLKTLYIDRLLNLTSICDQTLSFPPGASFSISGCPLLRKLPLDWNSATRRFSVYGDAEWWDNFECNPATRVTLKSGKSAGEMTLREAVREMKEIDGGTVEFRPLLGPSK